MSFFDDDEDSIEESPRRTPRSSAGGRSRGPSGAGSVRAGGGSRSGSRRGGGTDPAIERRRWIAVGVLVVAAILIILLISSCQARDTKTSLEDYNNSVSSLIDRSDHTGATVFKALSSGQGGSAIRTGLATPYQDARTELSDAENLGVPGQMSAAQSHLVLALQMRVDGINQIANNVSEVAGGSSGTGTSEAVGQIAAATARFYASDVVYKDYVTHEIAGALNGDNIPVGGSSNTQINPGQFLPDLGWLSETYIATELGTSVSSGGGGSGASGHDETQPGLHGDALDAVSAGSVTLSPTGTNTVAGSPAPTFTLSVTDAGDFPEYDVGCTVSIEGGPSGKGTISEITAGSTATCTVKLPSTVPAGTYPVTATVAKVPLETNLQNNTATYTVQFQ